jgi:hypothetical protein
MRIGLAALQTMLSPKSVLTKGGVLGACGGIGGIPGVFCAKAMPLSANKMTVVAAARRKYLETMSSTPFPATAPQCSYSGSVFVPDYWNVPVTAGAPVFGWPPPIDTE